VSHCAVMTDHPSWITGEDSTTVRAVRSGNSVWALTSSPHGASGPCQVNRVSGVGDRPTIDVIDPAAVVGDDDVAVGLRAGGAVARCRNPDLWDALATAIVRQVIRAGQARKLYRDFSRAHGDSVHTPAGTTWLFPTPQTVIDLAPEDYSGLGMAFKRRPLQSAARAYLTHGQRWAALDPAQLVGEIQSVHRIGPWTAGASIADFTNDFALYPYADLAVRTWAQRLAPQATWPAAEPDFARHWRETATTQLSERTLLTLAWGVRHATGAAF
jgi:DNA-3-methyladenine glycosylase II